MLDRRTALLGLALGPLLPAAAQKETKQPTYFGPRKRIAVAAIEVKVKGVTMVTALPSDPDKAVTSVLELSTTAGEIGFGSGFTEMLITALIQSDRFIVLERDNLARLIQEQKAIIPPLPADPNGGNNAAAGTPPPTDPNGAPATPTNDDPWDRATVAAGRILGAQVMVFGAITELHVGRSAKRFGRGAGELGKEGKPGFDPYFVPPLGNQVGGVLGEFTSQRSEARVVLDLRFVDVSTSQILKSVRAEGRVGADMSKLRVENLVKYSLSRSSETSSPLSAAVRNAIQDGVTKICAQMETVEWQAKVVGVDTDVMPPLLYINVGKEVGLKEGDVLDILRPGKELKDPDTGLVVGRIPPKAIGKGKVTRTTDPMVTEVAPLEGMEFQPGDIVRWPKPPAK